MDICFCLKLLCYISAGIQIAIWLLACIYAIFVIAAVSSNRFNTTRPRQTPEDEHFLGRVEIVMGVTILLFAIAHITLLSILMIGVKKNHLTLVSIYVYPTMVLIALHILNVLYNFIMGFVTKLPIGSIILGLCVNALGVVISVLMFLPMYFYHEQLRGLHCQPEKVISLLTDDNMLSK